MERLKALEKHDKIKLETENNVIYVRRASMCMPSHWKLISQQLKHAGFVNVGGTWFANIKNIKGD